MARTRASDFEEKQHGILMSAAAVFAEQGMEKASMAQIASHSGVSKALLYHYYPSKDELIFAIIHTHLVELEASVAAAVDEGLSPEAQLRVLVGVVLEKYRGADDAHRVQLVGTAALSEEQRGEIRGGGAADRAALLGGAAADQPRPRPARAAAADAGDHVALRHDELGLHVVPRRRARQPRGLCRGGDDADPGGDQGGAVNAL